MPSFRLMGDSTELYLIRHGLAGEAGAAADEMLRPLTALGRKRTRAVAKRLHGLRVHFDLLLSSPLLRAQQTAALFERAGLCEQLEESPLLAPGGDFRQWLGWLAKWRRRAGHRRLGLVGHMPALGAWAETLIFGEATQSLVLKKAGVVGLSLPQEGSPVGRCSLFLFTAPRYLL
ncbi:MAG: phosphohistidine phosphatase SixA [Myxococcaceae bacterium]